MKKLLILIGIVIFSNSLNAESHSSYLCISDYTLGLVWKNNNFTKVDGNYSLKFILKNMDDSYCEAMDRTKSPDSKQNCYNLRKIEQELNESNKVTNSYFCYETYSEDLKLLRIACPLDVGNFAMDIERSSFLHTESFYSMDSADKEIDLNKSRALVNYGKCNKL